MLQMEGSPELRLSSLTLGTAAPEQRAGAGGPGSGGRGGGQSRGGGVPRAACAAGLLPHSSS